MGQNLYTKARNLVFKELAVCLGSCLFYLLAILQISAGQQEFDSIIDYIKHDDWISANTQWESLRSSSALTPLEGKKIWNCEIARECKQRLLDDPDIVATFGFFKGLFYEIDGYAIRKRSVDLPGQVLNYALFGREEGLANLFVTSPEKCLFVTTQTGLHVEILFNKTLTQDSSYVTAEIVIEDLNNTSFDIYSFGLGTVIDLRKIDTRYLEILPVAIAEPNIKFSLYDDRWAVYNEGKRLISIAPDADHKRVSNGFRLIFEEYCEEQRKPF